MANSQQQQAHALKDSYVKTIIDTLGQGEGSTDPAVKMRAQNVAPTELASTHVFPTEGKVGGINDGDSTEYWHRNGRTIGVEGHPDNANPVPGAQPGDGSKVLKDMKPGMQDQTNYMMDILEGSNTRDRAFGGSNLAGKLGTEQGQQTSILHDLSRGINLYRNDGIPQTVITDGTKSTAIRNGGAAYPADGPRGHMEAGFMDRKHRTVTGDILYRDEAQGRTLHNPNYEGRRQTMGQYMDHYLRPYK